MKKEAKREPGTSQSPVLEDKNFRIVLGVTLMSVLGIASVTPAFPEISREMGLSAAGTALLVSVFTIPGLFFTPFFGLLADSHGRKKVLVPCLFLFGLAGGGCALVSNFQVLLALRFLQGVGASALNSLNVTLIGDFFTGRERSEAMGYNASVLGIGTASYPALGGLLATFGWRFPFALAFSGVFIGLWALTGLDESYRPEGTQKRRLALHGLKSAVFQRTTLLLLATSAMTFVILYGAFLTYLPFFLTDRYGASPLHVGLVAAAMSLASAVTASRSRILAERLSERCRLVATFFLYAGALALLLAIPSCCGTVLPAVLFGIGQGLNMPTLLTMLAELAPEENRAVFFSLNSMSLRLGQTVGPLFMGGVYFLFGIEAVFFGGAVLALFMVVLLCSLLGKSDIAA
ncbi:MAG: MFS transporter [Thermovirgaceae bacterium]